MNSTEIKYNASKCMCVFLSILNTIKIYHWQTLSHPRHKATDELYNNMSSLIDKFIEVLTGRLIIDLNDQTYRIPINENCMKLKDYLDNTDLELVKNIKIYLEKDELQQFINYYPELLNIRDEMLAEVNKTAYLFTLS